RALHLFRRRFRSARFRFGDEADAFAGVQRCREFTGGFGDDARGLGVGLRFFGALRRDLFGDRRQIVAQRLFPRLQRVHRFAPFRLRRLQFAETRLGGFLGDGDFALGGGDRVARLFDPPLRLRPPADRGLDFIPQRFYSTDDRVVVALDPVQVFGLGRHVGPVFGFEDRVG